MPEWATTLLAVIVGALITGAITEYRARKESKEKFRDMTFEKRLQAHQQAYSWCQKLNKVLNVGSDTTDGVADIHETAKKGREWWNDNCLLLDPKSRSSMLFLINRSHSYADKEPIEGTSVWSALVSAQKAIVTGIGHEYLPDSTELPDELKEVM